MIRLDDYMDEALNEATSPDNALKGWSRAATVYQKGLKKLIKDIGVINMESNSRMIYQKVVDLAMGQFNAIEHLGEELHIATEEMKKLKEFEV